MIHLFLLALAAQAAPPSAGPAPSGPQRMAMNDALELMIAVAEGEPQACLNAAPSTPDGLVAALNLCDSAVGGLEGKVASAPMLDPEARAMTQLILGEMGVQRVVLTLRSEGTPGPRVCKVAEHTYHQLGLVPKGVLPLDIEQGAISSRLELGQRLKSCRDRFPVPQDADPIG